MRVDDAVSLRIWLAAVGTLTSAEKINSETAIDSTVRIVRRLLRTRFFNTSAVYFTLTHASSHAPWLPPTPRAGPASRRASPRHPARAGLAAGEHALVEPIDGIDVALGAGVVRDHHDRFLELA